MKRIWLLALVSLSGCDDGRGPLLVTCYDSNGKMVNMRRYYGVEFAPGPLYKKCVVEDNP